MVVECLLEHVSQGIVQCVGGNKSICEMANEARISIRLKIFNDSNILVN